MFSLWIYCLHWNGESMGFVIFFFGCCCWGGLNGMKINIGIEYTQFKIYCEICECECIPRFTSFQEMNGKHWILLLFGNHHIAILMLQCLIICVAFIRSQWWWWYVCRKTMYANRQRIFKKYNQLNIAVKYTMPRQNGKQHKTERKIKKSCIYSPILLCIEHFWMLNGIRRRRSRRKRRREYRTIHMKYFNFILHRCEQWAGGAPVIKRIYTSNRSENMWSAWKKYRVKSLNDIWSETSNVQQHTHTNTLSHRMCNANGWHQFWRVQCRYEVPNLHHFLPDFHHHKLLILVTINVALFAISRWLFGAGAFRLC